MNRRHLAALLAAALLAGLLPASVVRAAVDRSHTVPVDGQVTISLQRTTVDTLSATFAIVTPPEHGDLSAIGPVDCGGTYVVCLAAVLYTPDEGFEGLDSFVYSSQHGAFGPSQATVSIEVAGSNDAPAAGDTCVIAREDDPVAVSPQANLFDPSISDPAPSDPNGDSLIAEFVTPPSTGTMTIRQNGTVAYAPALNAWSFGCTGPTFEYLVSDGNLDSGSVTADTWIIPVNDPPTFTPGGDVTVAEDSGAYDEPWATTISAGPGEAPLLQVVSFDVDAADTSLFSVQPAIGLGGRLTFTPSADASGSTTVTVSASDDGGTWSDAAGTYGDPTADPVQFTIAIDPPNDDPFAVDDSVTILEDAQPAVIDVLENDDDLDGDPLDIVSLTGGDATKGSAEIIQNGSLLHYHPVDDAFGSDTFTYTIDDGDGGTDTASVTVTLTPVNDAPTFTPGADQTWPEDGGTRTITGWASGVNRGPGESDQSVVYPIVSNSNPTLFSVAPRIGASTGNLSFTPAPNRHGTATLTLRIKDSGGTANGGVDIGQLEILTITIDPVNDTPTADAESLTIQEDAAATNVPVLAGDADIDGDTLTITAKTNGTKGTVAITGAGTGLSYKPGANKSGTDSFTYTISDGHGGTATATVSVTITPVNDAPNAVNDGAPTVISIPAGGPVSIPVLANDTDPDADVLTITPTMTNGAKGTVAITGGGTGLTYDPAALATGTDTFTYTVRDAGGLTDTATVLVTLLADTTAPTLSGLTERFPVHTMGTSSVLVRLAWAGADPGSGVASYQLQVSANGGAYANVPLASPTATTVDRTLALTTNAEYRFRIRATDAAGNTSAYRSWPVLKPVRFQEGTSLATYTGSWATATSANMSGGAGKFSSASNRRAMLTFTARDVAWVASRFTTSGRADVYVDGVKVATVNLDVGATQYRRLVFASNFPAGSGAHTMEIRPLGDGRVDIDAFVILR